MITARHGMLGRPCPITDRARLLLFSFPSGEDSYPSPSPSISVCWLPGRIPNLQHTTIIQTQIQYSTVQYSTVQHTTAYSVQ